MHQTAVDSGNPQSDKIGTGRDAFSLVELLTVIAIIGVLIGLLLPAIQSVRESARRTLCSNRLRQVGLGLQNYHSSFGRFPVGGVEWRPWNNSTNRQLAWSAYLLPFIEQTSVFERLDLNASFDSLVNRPAAATIISTYLCPSSERGPSLIDGRGPSDFGGIFGERISGPNNPPKGTMLYDQEIAASDILDGLSNTLIVAEDTHSRDGQWINGRNLFDQAFAINGGPDFENDIRSDHPAGANACFCDGHVQFLPNRLALEPLAAICTRAGSEIIAEIEDQ